MTKRYVTIVATVEVPDDGLWDQIINRSMSDLVEAHGLPLAPCDWTPDVDTLTDGLGAEYGTVTVLDMNPPRVHPIEGCICDSSIVDFHLEGCPEA